MLQSISSYSFQAMAHLDFPRRYFDSWEIPEKTINSILELMIKKEILLEIIAMLQQSIAALDDNAAFRVCNHIAGVHLEKIRFQPEPCFS